MNNTEKQQKILQMAKDICRHQNVCNDVCKPISACDALRYAERAVEAGYVKQSEGEWIVKRFNSKREFITCSTCNSVIDCIYQNVDEREFDFCPYCGAKMKGGE